MEEEGARSFLLGESIVSPVQTTLINLCGSKKGRESTQGVRKCQDNAHICLQSALDA